MNKFWPLIFPRSKKARKIVALNILLYSSIFLVCGFAWSILNQWDRYRSSLEEITNIDGPLNWNSHSYAIDSYDLLLSLWRLRSYCLAYASGLTSRNDFNAQRRQIVGHFTSYGDGTPQGIQSRKYKTFQSAYSRVQEYLKNAELLENNKGNIDIAIQSSKEAI